MTSTESEARTFRVDYRQTLDQMIAAGGYDHHECGDKGNPRHLPPCTRHRAQRSLAIASWTG